MDEIQRVAIDLNVNVNITDRASADKLDRILQLLGTVITKEVSMANSLDTLTAEVARNTTVQGSALILIQGFAAQLAAAGTDPTKLAALAKTLTDNDDALAAAVAQNTPAA